MNLKSLFKKRFGDTAARFLQKEDGVVSIEAIMVFPLLFWSVFTAYSYFDGYRQGASNLKAAYAVADILSREKDTVTDQYITSMYDLQNYMIEEGNGLSLRISFVRWDTGDESTDTDDRHFVEWSCTRGEGLKRWSNATVEQVSDRIPIMADNATMILVETRHHYVRPFKLGFGSNNFFIDKFIFTQPRGYTFIEGPDSCKDANNVDDGGGSTEHDDSTPEDTATVDPVTAVTP
ncbi:hypothetical protein J7394_01200 [Ruegeria sp. R13_0]|uniref:TadE/TadG family type IV pilus assembly protein n=1 Tax=Ruegeria sp. R13_0 TaxID=2821099 RepID=UPI001ADB05C9|nr:hypothetical protein [Ruegeria sp. R13_0]MBO9432800.1 hypothetical protein [Ruegeria sp. R13_0]